MKLYEANMLIENITYVDRSEWERTRLNMWATIQSQSTKKINISDLMKFEWENDAHEHNSILTDNDKVKLQQRAQKYLQMVNGK